MVIGGLVGVLMTRMLPADMPAWAMVTLSILGSAVSGAIYAALPLSDSAQGDGNTHLMLMIAANEITPAMTQMLLAGQADAKGLLCAAWYSEIIDSSLNNMQTLPDGAERTALSETIVQMQSALETWRDISKLDIP